MENQLIVKKSETSLFQQGDTFPNAIKFADYLAKSKFVPPDFQNNPYNCLAALDISQRLGMSYLTVMQGMPAVKGRLGMTGQFATTLLMDSGLVEMPIKYDFKRDSKGKIQEATCTVRLKGSGETLSETLTWATVAANEWDKDITTKNGYKMVSNWNKDPDMMFRYRTVLRLCRIHFPHVLQGLYTKEELYEMPDEEFSSSANPLTKAMSKPAESPSPEASADVLASLAPKIEEAVTEDVTLVDEYKSLVSQAQKDLGKDGAKKLVEDVKQKLGYEDFLALTEELKGEVINQLDIDLAETIEQQAIGEA